MKPALFLLMIVISLCLSYIKSISCLKNMSIACRLIFSTPFYNYDCVCQSNDALNILWEEYKVIKTCGANEEPYCYQNNLYSPEFYCECRR